MAECHHKERVGVVKSNKMQKTVIVEVTRLVQHSMYQKVVKQRKKYAVHDEKGLAKLGDKVRIREVKPLSRTKRWSLVEVLAS